MRHYHLQNTPAFLPFREEGHDSRPAGQRRGPDIPTRTKVLRGDGGPGERGRVCQSVPHPPGKPRPRPETKPLFVAVLTVEFALDGNDNLKAKRRVANSLKQKVRNRFNVAIAEAGTENSLTRLRLAVTSISNSESHLRSRMDKCALMMEAVCTEEMTDSEVEIYAVDD